MAEYDVPIGSSYVPRQTPLHVSQVVLFFIKQIFELQTAADNTFTWYYDSSDYENSRIAFDTGYNPDSKIYGGRPTVVVNRTNVSNQTMSLNRDVAYSNIPAGLDSKSTVVNSGAQILIKSKKSEEADILGNYIYAILLAFRPYLPKLTGILNIQNITLSGVTKYAEDDNYYVTNIMVSYLMQINWKHYISVEQLNSIYLNLVEEQNRDHRSGIIT